MLRSTYRIVIRFVDDSYWDDGSRWTTRELKFDDRKSAVKEYERIRSEKTWSGYGHGGEKTFYIDEVELYQLKKVKIS